MFANKSATYTLISNPQAHYSMPMISKDFATPVDTIGY